jgi:hypothetical protein
MTFDVRLADVRLESERMVSLLHSHFEDWQDEGRFSWLYSSCPWGQAKVWVLESSEKLVGLSAAFPRRVLAGDLARRAWVLGDFCVGKEHRSLGPAVALQRAACEAVDRGEVDLWYDFPSRAMRAIYGRMGIRPAGEMIRMVYPLRVDSFVDKKVAHPALRQSVSAIGNVVLGARDSLRRRDRTVEVRPFDRDFEGSFSSGLENAGGVHVEKTADYLNWRYRRDPRGPGSFLEAGGGFLGFRLDASQLGIVDMFGTDDTSVLQELVLEAIEIGRAEQASSVVVSISDRHPWKAVFEAVGFNARDSVPFVVYERPGVLEEGTPWFLMSGDRDS